MPKTYLILSGDHILFEEKNGKFCLPDERFVDGMKQELHTLFPLAQWHDKEYYVAHFPTKELSQGSFILLREAYSHLGADLFQLVGRARQLLEWRLDHQFCGRCGASTDFFDQDRAKKCSSCELVNYPRIAPCIMVAVIKGNEILLARPAHFRAEMFSVLAGFVEPGETLEDCVHREVFEEVGLKIKNLSYVASQSWPFPNLLMLGFMADYAEGEIRVDAVEIEKAKWFRRNAMPILPLPFSLSYQLIQKFIYEP